MSRNTSETIAHFWDKTALNKEAIVETLWTSNPLVRSRINYLISGDPRFDMYQFAIAQIHASGTTFPVSRVGILGCGTGELERGLVQYNLAKQYWGYDISPLSIAIATDQARRIDPTLFRYQVADLNTFDLGNERYDIIFVSMAIHHIENLEFIAASIDQALAPKGWLVMNEFIGPSRFQWTDRQLDIINRALSTLPLELKITLSGSQKHAVGRESIAHMIAVDPSESVRSSDIVDIFARTFETIARKNYGGTILHMLLASIAHNFCGDFGETVLKQLFLLEDIALESGIIDSDFALIIQRKKPHLTTQ